MAFILRYRILTLLLIIGISAFLVTRIGALKLDNDPDIWAPQSHPYIKATRDIQGTFGGRNVAAIGVAPRAGDIYQPAILEKIVRIQAGIERVPGAVRRNVVSLAARKVKSIHGSQDGLEVQQLMERVPRSAGDLSVLKSRVEANPAYGGLLVSSDHRAATIVADFEVDKNDPSYARLYDAIREVVDKERDDTVDIFLGGVPVTVGVFEYEMMKMPALFGAALLIMLAIQYWSFRSVQGMVLPLITALMSVLWGLGLMGLFDVHMDGLNTTTPILIMAVATGHAIQILKRYYEEYRRLDDSGKYASGSDLNAPALIETMVRVGPAMITAGLIAAISFYSLAAADVSVVRSFGVFAGSGILATLILEMTLIPVIRSMLPPPSQRERTREVREDALDRMLRWLAKQLISGNAPKLLFFGCVMTLLAVAGTFRLKADNSMINYNAEGSQVRKDNAALNQHMGGTSSVFFIIETQAQDGLKQPEVMKGIASLQAYLDKQPFVGKTQSITDFVKQINRAMHENDAGYFAIPDRRDLIAQYLFLYSMSGGPQDFDSYVDNDYRKAIIWVYLKSDSTINAEALYQRAKTVIAANFPAGVTVRIGGTLPQTIAINEVLTKGKLENMAQMALIVFLLSALVLRSWVGGLFVVTPLIAILLANFGLMGWLHVPLDMGTAATAAMAVGIGADYELYLLFRFREELAKTGDLAKATMRSLMTSGKAIVFVALSVAGGYATLLTSDFAFYSRLSVAVIATMLASLVSALIFLRAMVVVFKPKFMFDRLPADEVAIQGFQQRGLA